MTSNYRQHGRLQGHIGRLFCIVATDDGKYLASGGHDGTRLWDLQRMSEIPGRPAITGTRGSTTAITWASRDDDPGETLFYGTVHGHLVCWRQMGNQGFQESYCRRIAQPSEISGLQFDSLSNRLAVCNRNAVIQLYMLSSSAPPEILFSVTVTNFDPRALHFGAMRGNERELLVFGSHDGKIRTFISSVDLNNQPENWEIGGCIGDADIDSRRGTICIDDLASGVALYRLDDHHRVKLFPVPSKKEMRPRQVRFVDDSRSIVAGSDHGIIYIFDRRSGDIVQKLKLDGEDWAQTIATSDSNTMPTIFACKSGEHGSANDIIMWRKGPEGLPITTTIVGLIQLGLVLGTLGFAYQNKEILGGVVGEKLGWLKNRMS